MKRLVPALRWTLVVVSLLYSLGLSSGAASSGVHGSSSPASPPPSSWSTLPRSIGWDGASLAGRSVVAASNDSTGQKTVHVKGYTKKDGTKVEGYDR